ncbi:MAG: AzlC family ABC transporter permease [Desulfobulbaceae bacterium]|jgi:4-azaleucine resistance transporter AzlC|nr:AzlC family ABC transporter permease [Desulfobulbaceae bacterium]
MSERNAVPPPLSTLIQNALPTVLPVILGYLPVGFAYGVLAEKSGLSLFNTVTMSVLVYAGSAQLIGTGLIAGGGGAAALIFTTFVVNLRHLLMSAALATRLTDWKKWQVALFTAEMTDETFALHSLRLAAANPPKAETFAVNLFAHSAWIIGSLTGFLVGGRITDVKPIGLDYALPAMFIALLTPQVMKPLYLAMAVLAAALSVTLLLLGFDRIHVILATMICATLGACLAPWINRKSS